MRKLCRILSMAAVLVAAVLPVTLSSSAFAQNQLPLDFRGLTLLETGPNWLAGPEDDLITQRSHAGHAAADVRPALSSRTSSAAIAAALTSAPRTKPQRVVAADRGFIGFPGLSHF